MTNWTWWFYAVSERASWAYVGITILWKAYEFKLLSIMMIMLWLGGFITLVCGEKVRTLIAIGKLSKFLDWTCVAITLYNMGFFFLFFPPPPFFFSGMSESEQALKGTSQIKILSSEDIEGMRVVCRVRWFWFSLRSAFIL